MAILSFLCPHCGHILSKCQMITDTDGAPEFAAIDVHTCESFAGGKLNGCGLDFAIYVTAEYSVQTKKII